MKTSLGQKIRKVRVSKELTQDNLAYELGITKSAYSKIERDETNVSISRLTEIAKILEVNIVDFFKEVDTKVEDSQNDYGFATKKDIEEMAKMIAVLTKEVSLLKASLPPKSKVAKNKK